MSYLALARRILAEDGIAADPPSPAIPEPPHGCGRCFDCAAELPSGEQIAQCQACRSERGRHSIPPPGSITYPLMVVVEGEVPHRAAADVAALRRVVAAYAAVWHRDENVPEATKLGARIDELLERLAARGTTVWVVPLQ